MLSLMTGRANLLCGHKGLPPLLRRVNAPRPCSNKSFLGEGFQKLFKLSKGDDSATFAELDTESEGGLGGTSDEVFGPLVRLQSCLHRVTITFYLHESSATFRST